MEQRFTFDQAARLYSSARPGYPPTLRDEIVSIVGLRPEDAILESVAARARRHGGSRLLGYRIVALDPGAQMIEIARESLKEFANIELCRLDVRGLAGAVGGVRARNPSIGTPCSCSPPVRPCQGSGPGLRPAATSASRPR